MLTRGWKADYSPGSAHNVAWADTLIQGLESKRQHHGARRQALAASVFPLHTKEWFACGRYPEIPGSRSLLHSVERQVRGQPFGAMCCNGGRGSSSCESKSYFSAFLPMTGEFQHVTLKGFSGSLTESLLFQPSKKFWKPSNDA